MRVRAHSFVVSVCVCTVHCDTMISNRRVSHADFLYERMLHNRRVALQVYPTSVHCDYYSLTLQLVIILGLIL